MTYAKLNEVKSGTVLVPDDGFTCIPAGVPVVVQWDYSGFFIPCQYGHHYLDGQLNKSNEYVGLSLQA